MDFGLFGLSPKTLDSSKWCTTMHILDYLHHNPISNRIVDKNINNSSECEFISLNRPDPLER